MHPIYLKLYDRDHSQKLGTGTKQTTNDIFPHEAGHRSSHIQALIACSLCDKRVLELSNWCHLFLTRGEQDGGTNPQLVKLIARRTRLLFIKVMGSLTVSATRTNLIQSSHTTLETLLSFSLYECILSQVSSSSARVPGHRLQTIHWLHIHILLNAVKVR